MTNRTNFENRRYDRGSRRGGTDDSQDELLVFGYASRIYSSDERAELIAEERHLIAHPADAELLTDRYDCRLHLLSVEALNISCTAESSGVQLDGIGYDCPAELLEEEMCEEERYRDLRNNIRRMEEEIERQKRAEIAFDYDGGSKVESSSSEEEIDEPFQPPENIKLPLGMNLPDSVKQNAVIERTAIFVVSQGPQMEIVIKAKQRGNQDQFGFLEFDHPLNAYYKYVSKLIREKKYVPKPHTPKRRPKLKKLLRLEEEKQSAKEQQQTKDEDQCSHSDESSDSDGSGDYLHPLLMGGTRKSYSCSSSPVIGPKTKEENENVSKEESQAKNDYKLGKADDMYSSLFKNLSDLVVLQTKTVTRDESAEKTRKELEKGDYYEWYLGFYGEPPPCNEQPNVIPPPPDIMPTVNNAAEYVARYGVQAEQALLARQDLNIGFLHVDEPYYGYYHSRIRYYQKAHTSYLQPEKALEKPETESCTDETAEVNDDLRTYELEQSNAVDGDISYEQPSTSAAFSDLLQAPPPPPPFMNRKMRRRGFHDPPYTPQPSENVADVGVVDLAIQLNKVHSSPALLDIINEEKNSNLSTKKLPSGPISFSLNIQKTDDRMVTKVASAVKLGAYEDEENGETEAVDVPPGVLTNIPPPGLTIPPPPAAPIPLSTGQLAAEGSAELQSERKLKARLFMEKILNEKRAAKLRAQNEEQQKRESESLKKFEEVHGSSVSSPTTKLKNKGNADGIEVLFPASEIDELINLRIDKVINETLKQKKDLRHAKNRHKKEEKRRMGRSHENTGSSEGSGTVGKTHKRRRRSKDSPDSSKRKISRRKKHKKRRNRSSSSTD